MRAAGAHAISNVMTLRHRLIAIVQGLLFLQLSLLGTAAPCPMHRADDRANSELANSMYGRRSADNCHAAAQGSGRRPSAPLAATSCASMAGCAPTNAALLADPSDAPTIVGAADLPEPRAVASTLAAAPELPPPRG